MFDGFLDGIVAGLFGPAIAKWLSKFKYWLLLLVTALAIHGVAFALDWMRTDFFGALNRSSSFFFTVVGFFVPLGVGLLVVFVAFIGFLNVPKKDKGSGDSQGK